MIRNLTIILVLLSGVVMADYQGPWTEAKITKLTVKETREFHVPYPSQGWSFISYGGSCDGGRYKRTVILILSSDTSIQKGMGTNTKTTIECTRQTN